MQPRLAHGMRHGQPWLVCRVGALTAAMLVGACAHSGRVETPAARQPATPAVQVPAGDGGFTIAENVLDTWNTIGKILVRTDGVQYETRAQMLGLYGVRYRGKRFLIHTQAIVLEGAADRTHTRVTALEMDGKPARDDATAALLAILQQRVPVEVGQYRQPIFPAKPPARRHKRASHGG